jgi:hypothetical protein
MKTTKLNTGFYKIETSNETLQLVAYNTDVKEPIFWIVQRPTDWGSWYEIDIEFRTKKDAIEYIKNELQYKEKK